MKESESLLRDFENLESVGNRLKSIITRVRLKEPVSVISISGMGKRPYLEYLTDYFQKVDFGFELVSQNITSIQEFDELLHMLETKEKFVPTLVVLRLAFEEDCFDQLKRLESLREKHYTNFVSILLCNLRNIYKAYHEKLQVITKSAFIIKPFTESESFKILKSYEVKYDLKISTNAKDKIAILSGGHTGLIKNIFLREIDNPNSDHEIIGLLDDEGVVRWLEQICKDLPKNVLEDILSRTKSIESQEILKKFGIINEKGKVFSPVFENYLEKKLKSAPQLPVDLKLTNQEKQVYDYLIKNAGNIISREEIGDIMWGEKSAENYSEWSIDQMIYRIRKKIKLLQNGDQIVTKKKMGFVFLRNS